MRFASDGVNIELVVIMASAECADATYFERVCVAASEIIAATRFGAEYMGL